MKLKKVSREVEVEERQPSITFENANRVMSYHVKSRQMTIYHWSGTSPLPPSCRKRANISLLFNMEVGDQVRPGDVHLRFLM